MRRYLRDPTFSRFDTTPECDRHTTTAYTALSIASRGNKKEWSGNDCAKQNNIENNYKHKLVTITRPSRSPYTTYAQRNYSQKDVLSVLVTEVSEHTV